MIHTYKLVLHKNWSLFQKHLNSWYVDECQVNGNEEHGANSKKI